MLRSRKALLRSKAVVSLRERQNEGRLEPSFFVAGTRKGGTTFLWRLLAAHPQVREPVLKELNYFGKADRQSVDTYRSFFPVAAEDGLVTGESTPHYMYYPQVAPRLAAAFPNAKILVVLREPAGRAFSEWRMNVDRGMETLRFEEALEKEEERLAGEFERSANEPGYWSHSLAEYSYKARGRYLEQIQRLERFFPKRNILVVKSSVLFKDTERVLRQVEEFLGIAQWAPETIVPENVGTNKTKPSPESMDGLKEYFRPYDEALFDHLGWEPGW